MSSFNSYGMLQFQIDGTTCWLAYVGYLHVVVLIRIGKKLRRSGIARRTWRHYFSGMETRIENGLELMAAGKATAVAEGACDQDRNIARKRLLQGKALA